MNRNSSEFPTDGAGGRRRWVPLAAAVALAAAACSDPAPEEKMDEPVRHDGEVFRPESVDEMLWEISPERIRATVDALVSFGTRHTLSDTASDTRGIGAARR